MVPQCALRCALIANDVAMPRSMVSPTPSDVYQISSKYILSIYMCVCVFLFLQAFTPLPFQEKTMDYMVIQLGPQTLDVSTRLRSDRDS